MMEIVAAIGKCSSRSRAWHTTALLLLLLLLPLLPLLLLLLTTASLESPNRPTREIEIERERVLEHTL